ncbi:hypothetical protein RQP46_006727 [Phenoliferia psychrophenolica]
MADPEDTRLPYELHLAILEHGTAHLPPRMRSRRLAALATVCRDWYHPARSLLFASPTLPADSIWLLARTLRHDPRLSPLVTSLDIYSISTVGSPLLAALLTTTTRLKDVRLRFFKLSHTTRERDWDGVLDLLESKRLERLHWIGGGGDVSRCFAWQGLRELKVAEHDFYLVDSLLRNDAQRSTNPAASLETLSLSRSTFPYNFFERLQPHLRAVTDLSLSSDLPYFSSDIDRCLATLGPNLRRLSLLGIPAGRRALLPTAFAPLTSLVQLELSGELVEPSVIITLPSCVKTLCIVPGELDPDRLLLELLRRKVGLVVGSEGLAAISFKFIDLRARRDPKARTRWEASRESLEAASTIIGAEPGRTLALQFLE